MSSFTHSNQVFLGLPLPTLPSTFKSSMHFLTHSSPFHSTCPNHLSLPRLTTSDTQSIPSLPSALHLTDASLLRHHTFAAPCSPLPSSTSAYPQLSVPMSHYRISSHSAHRLCVKLSLQI